MSYGLEPTPDFWRVRFDRRVRVGAGCLAEPGDPNQSPWNRFPTPEEMRGEVTRVGADPTSPDAPPAPGSDKWFHSTDDILHYAQYIDQLVVRLDAAARYWETDPPGCLGQRCILAYAQWNAEMGAAGPWQSWREQWAAFLLDLQVSYWARLGTHWDTLEGRQNELLRLLAQARALGLPNVPPDLPMPIQPTGPGGTLGNVGDQFKKGAEKVESVVDKLLIGAAIIGGFLIVREMRAT